MCRKLIADHGPFVMYERCIQLGPRTFFSLYKRTEAYEKKQIRCKKVETKTQIAMNEFTT